ncbi:flagellar motor protein MotB [Thermogutta sp.]|uniref:OmpA/MotB family protein n=1 Tax=Thermogutta sp. TaxID=1962930 RepID=UPI0032205952
MGRLKQESSGGGGGAPEWVLTYGDMMSLLLTFFIMLAALSEVKKEDQFEALAEALRRRFGKYVSLDELALYYKPTVATPLKSVSEGREKLAKTLEGASKVKGPRGREAKVRSIRPGDEATTGGVVFFEEGTDQPLPGFDESLKKIAESLAGKPQKIEIRGHTSARPLPPGSSFRTHWDLAYAECLRVMEKLVELGIEPERIRISVAAANEPLFTDPDPEKRKQNARVEIALLNELTTSGSIFPSKGG